ncbi:MAG: rRNA maturation RNase YbeY [Kaistella sp.]|nr:rRNA maturation RNase YbeY [Kaistella sp.]
MIHFFFESIDEIEIPSNTIKWLENLIISENRKMGDINYIFCDDEYLLQVNRDYLQHDYYTDIITFDYVKGKIISGDIFVSLPRVSENADLHQKNYDSEFHRVLAHGLLHLCGYRDKSQMEIEEMRRKEDFYLSVKPE